MWPAREQGQRGTTNGAVKVTDQRKEYLEDLEALPSTQTDSGPKLDRDERVQRQKRNAQSL